MTSNTNPLRPLKDVDATERARMIHASAWLLPALLVIGAFAARIAGWVAGVLVVLGGAFFFYGVLYAGVIGGAAGFLGSLYGGSRQPVESQPAYSRARALARRGQHDDALKVLEGEVALDPGNPGPYLAAAAIAWEEMGDRELAASWYRRARGAERITDEIGAYLCVRLADIYETDGETRRAASELRRLIESYPGSRYVGHAGKRLQELKSEGGEVRREGQV
ncbi:MAG: tetratricopeptide repeat protein [Gemmatimonadota bacterium]|nr:MAG: tetratricopeptide repeat protein [Gemmatimonadota bacterium]